MNLHLKFITLALLFLVCIRCSTIHEFTSIDIKNKLSNAQQKLEIEIELQDPDKIESVEIFVNPINHKEIFSNIQKKKWKHRISILTDELSNQDVEIIIQITDQLGNYTEDSSYVHIK